MRITVLSTWQFPSLRHRSWGDLEKKLNIWRAWSQLLSLWISQSWCCTIAAACIVSELSQSSTAKLSVSLRVFSSILDLESCHHSTSNGCSTQLTLLCTLLFHGLYVDFSIQYWIPGLVRITEHLWIVDIRRYLDNNFQSFATVIKIELLWKKH